MSSTKPLGAVCTSVAGTLSSTGENARALVAQAPVSCLKPRLVSMRDAATYLGVHLNTVRDLVSAGHIPRVNLPLASRDLRRVLLDVRDLERLVDNAKDA